MIIGLLLNHNLNDISTKKQDITDETKLTEKFKNYRERVIWWKKYAWMDPKMKDKTQELSQKPSNFQTEAQKVSTQKKGSK